MSKYKKRTCWVHIGMHKTASTAIQKTLANNKADDWQFIYFNRYINASMPLFSMFDTNPIRYHWFQKKNFNGKDIERFSKKMFSIFENCIKKSTAKNFIISGEAIPLIDETGLKKFKSYLEKYFDNIYIIGYVRPPGGFLSSMQQQRIKMGRKKLLPFISRPIYSNRFKKMDVIFGRENVFLHKFSKDTFKNQCAVEHFFHLLSLPLNTEVVTANEALSEPACHILWAYRNYGDGYGTDKNAVYENQYIFRALRQLKGAPFRIDKRTLTKYKTEQAGDLAWMEDRLGESLEEDILQFPENSKEVLITFNDFKIFQQALAKLSAKKLPLPPDTNHFVDHKVAAHYVGEYRRLIFKYRRLYRNIIRSLLRL